MRQNSIADSMGIPSFV